MLYIQEERSGNSYQLRRFIGLDIDIYENIEKIQDAYIKGSVSNTKKIKGLNGITYEKTIGDIKIRGYMIKINGKRKKQIKKLAKHSLYTGFMSIKTKCSEGMKWRS